jgi:hypothetical protein
MMHRHLNHQRFTLAAIDDIIGRGKKRDWRELRTEVVRDPELVERVLRICRAHVNDPRAQRYHLWMHYAERQRAGLGEGPYLRSSPPADPA